MIRVSVVGATGYTGGELLRILIRHPEVELRHLTSENYVGQSISDIHTFLRGRLSHLCEKYNAAQIAADTDVVFLGLPHGTAAKTGAELHKKGVRVIDLSADFRLRKLATSEKWYGAHPAPALLKEAVYGLPERYRAEIVDARLVANPGCYATTSILAGLPLFAGGLVGRGATVIVDAKSGISGAGKKLDPMYLFAEANENMQAYALKGHRHQPEIAQEWEASARKKPSFEMLFTPHLVPLTRGIFSTVYVPLAKKLSLGSLRDIFLDYYHTEPFVHVLAAGTSPEIKAVAHTNMCHLGVSLSSNGETAVIMGVLDNLVKGASGQAVQNMNIMFGLKEETAL